MKRELRRPSPMTSFRIAIAFLLVVSGARATSARAVAPPAVTPSGGSTAAGNSDRDAELARRLDALLAGTEPGAAWSVSIEAVGEKDRLVHRIRIWSGGIGIWDDESQFRLEPPAQREILKAFRDQGFCRLNDELFKEGSGRKENPHGLTQEQSITLEIGGVTKTVTHTVLTHGRYPDVEEAARSLVEIVKVSRAVCEGPAGKGVRATDLPDGLSKVASQKLADVALKLFVNRQEEEAGSGWLTRVEGERVTTQAWTKGKGWGPPVELRLSADEFLELVRRVAAAKPGAFPKNLYDDGYTDLSLSVLNRSVNVQARPFTGMDPKRHEEARKAFRSVVAEARKLHDKALLEGKAP